MTLTLRRITSIIIAFALLAPACVRVYAIPAAYTLKSELTVRHQGFAYRCSAYAFSTAMEICGYDVDPDELAVAAGDNTGRMGLHLPQLMPAAETMIDAAISAKQLDATEKIKTAVYSGEAVWMTIWMDSKNNIVAESQIEDISKYVYHAVVCIGWTRNGLIVQNSYGDEWGFRGRSYVPDDSWCKAWIINVDAN